MPMDKRSFPAVTSMHCSTLSQLPSSSSDAPTIVARDTELFSANTSLSDSSSKSTKPCDAADLFVLLCYFILIAASIILSGIVIGSVNYDSPPTLSQILSVLQKLIASFSVSITTATIVVIGRRYTLFKLAKEGMRSRRVSVYSNPSIANIASHLVLQKAEFRLLGLPAVWGLALATSLTVNEIWEMGPISSRMPAPILSGPLTPANPDPSYVFAASEQLAGVMSSLCFRQVDAFGVINVTGVNAVEAHQQVGVICYPTPPQWAASVGFAYSTTLNAFNVSIESLSSVPSTAQNVTCTKSLTYPYPRLWLDGSDNQTLTIVVAGSESSGPSSIYRVNATLITIGGTLSSAGNAKEFVANGTSWASTTMTSNQWAQDIVTLMCNTTCPSSCGIGISSLFDFADTLNGWTYPYTTLGIGQTMSSALGMALGAYSSVVLQSASGSELITIQVYDSIFTVRYGIYILILSIIVSIVVLLVALRLRVISPLGPDFINSTRLLLDPLKKPELFNASLDDTMEALADPCIVVKEGKVLLLGEVRSKTDSRKWTGTAFLCGWNLFRDRRTKDSGSLDI